MDPSLCANGCGFFGSSETHNMCSKCYKDRVLAKMISQSMKNLTISSSPPPPPSSSDEHKNDESSTTAMNFRASASVSQELQRKNRCHSCNKRVGVTGFRCRCGDLFCGKHRYPEEHSCTMDYKKIGRELLQKQNPLCKADKISRA